MGKYLMNELEETRGERRVAPSALRCDNRPEYLSQTWVDRVNSKQNDPAVHPEPGKPTQNAYIERFNRTARHQWLDMHLFEKYYPCSTFGHSMALAVQ